MKDKSPSSMTVSKVKPRAARAKSMKAEKSAKPATAPKMTSPKTPRAKKKSLIQNIADTAKEFIKPKQVKVEPKTEITAETKVRRTYTRKKKIETPAILLEGDQPAPAAVSGPGEKFALGPTPPAQTFPAAESELPESYGTKKLFLTARDPHWLYANWDLTPDQQNKLNAKSSEGHLVLRIYHNKIEGHPAYEIHVHPESRHWFAHVERAGNSYVAELGYYSPLGRWTRIASSTATVTPPDAASPATEVDFATIPFEFPFVRLMEIIKAAIGENLPLAEAIEELRRGGHPQLPKLSGSSTNGHAPVWTPEQEKALAKIIAIDQTRRIWMGSLEITELIRRRLTQDISSLGVSSFGVSSFSSPTGGMEKHKGFWFNVNAELIIYGATEPDAKVTLGGHQIKLRPDGSFSYRFALPDGNYDLPAVAVSADGDDARAAELKFSRKTDYLGDVGVHPQDPSLKAPLPENV